MSPTSTSRRATRPSARRPRRIALVALFVALATALTAAPAHATSVTGQYLSWSCKNAAGTPVPTTGWSNNAAGLPYGLTATEACGSPGQGLHVDFGGGNDAIYGGNMVAWTYHAPAGTTLGPVTLDRNWIVTQNAADTSYVSAAIGLYSGGMAYNVNLTGDQCQAYYGSSQCYTQDGAYSIAGGGDNTFTFNAGCLGSPDHQFWCGNSTLGRAGYTVRSAAITLNDPTAPAIVGSMGGSITSGAPLKGEQKLAFEVADSGSGVLAVQVAIDDKVVVPRRETDTNGGRCVLTGRDTGFNAQVPCPLDVQPQIPIPTSGVADGHHTLYATVWDAAGNARNLPPVNFVTANYPVTATPTPGSTLPFATPAPTITPTPTAGGGATPGTGTGTTPGTGGGAPGAPNGVGGDRLTAKFVPDAKKDVLSARYGATKKITGHLVDAAGKPITGAVLDVREAVALLGATQAKTTTVQTDAKGAYEYKFTAQSSRSITLAYAPTGGSTSYSAQSVTELRTSVGVSLKLTRSSVGRGGTVGFAGKVSVDPQPADGHRVLIEGKQHGGWVLAAALKTGKDGAFSWHHTFRLRGSWRFRARVLASVDLAARPASSALRPLRIH